MLRKTSLSATLVALVAMALFASGAMAKGPPGGIEEEPTEAANNLSVPAIFVPGTAGAPTLYTACGEAVAPGAVATNLTTYFSSPLPPAPAGDYYLQGEDRWQASCAEDADGLNVTAAWGDNLVSAPLKARTPIRVEMGLMSAEATSMTGFEIFKLTDELDRYATYGTLGVAVTPYTEVRVWDGAAHLRIARADGLVVYDDAFTAEINATGRVVYGYNWSRPLAGIYTITFTAPTVMIGSADAGTVVDAHTVTLVVDVAATAGGGGGGGGNGGPH